MISPVRVAQLGMDQCGSSGCILVYRLDGIDDRVKFVPNDHGK
jgi:hypothetical protein